jgi:hypothetical protein
MQQVLKLLLSSSLLQVSEDSVYGHSRKIWEEAKAAMDRGIYEPVLDPATVHCLKTLPWW